MFISLHTFLLGFPFFFFTLVSSFPASELLSTCFPFNSTSPCLFASVLLSPCLPFSRCYYPFHLSASLIPLHLPSLLPLTFLHTLSTFLFYSKHASLPTLTSPHYLVSFFYLAPNDFFHTRNKRTGTPLTRHTQKVGRETEIAGCHVCLSFSMRYCSFHPLQ